MVFVGVAITWTDKPTSSKYNLDKHTNQHRKSRATTAMMEDCMGAVKRPEATHSDQLELECQNTSDKERVTL